MNTKKLSMDEEAQSLAQFLGEQGHYDPIVLVLQPGHPAIKKWEGGCLQVWSEDDCFVPLSWKDLPVLHKRADISDLLEDFDCGCDKDDER